MQVSMCGKLLKIGSDSSCTAQTAELQSKSGLSPVFTVKRLCCGVGIQLKMKKFDIYGDLK